MVHLSESGRLSHLVDFEGFSPQTLPFIKSIAWHCGQVPFSQMMARELLDEALENSKLSQMEVARWTLPDTEPHSSEESNRIGNPYATSNLRGQVLNKRQMVAIESVTE